MQLNMAQHSYDTKANKLLETLADLELLQKRLDRIEQSGADVGLDPMLKIDKEIACMKYDAWKPKMLCGSCTEGSNDVEVCLPCGHLLCQ